jgi:ABC-2 type transport system ATP-binding protein
MTEPIIEAEGLVKWFGKVEALAGLDLLARSGQITAMLGPNGAGKTTFVRAVATLIRPNAGRLSVAGIDVARHPEQVRRVIGLAGQYAAVEPTMTGRENLRMVARLFGLSRRQAGAGARRIGPGAPRRRHQPAHARGLRRAVGDLHGRPGAGRARHRGRRHRPSPPDPGRGLPGRDRRAGRVRPVRRARARRVNP